MCDDNSDRGFVRNRYFEGLILTAKDLRDEQEYHISKSRFFHRCMYGSRIVCGLEVELIRYQILIQKGLCLDCCGREIYLPTQNKISLPEKDDIYYLVLSYKEIGINPVTPLPLPSSTHDMEYRQIEETYEIMWQTNDPFLGHEFKDGAWKACGHSHPVALAKIAKKRDSITLIEHHRLNNESRLLRDPA